MFTKLASLTLISALAFVEDIEIRPSLIPGDAFRLQVAQSREDSSRPQMNGTSRTLVDVQVVSAGVGGTVVDWIPGETTFDNPQVLQDPTMAAAARAAKGMRFRLSLSPDGEITGLVNEAEIRARLQAMVKTIVDELAAKLPVAQRKSFQETVGQILSPAVLISSATRDAEIYLGLNGIALTPGETVEAELEQPSPVGGGPIPAVFRVRMDSATAASAFITTSTTYDKEALTKMTAALAQRAGASLPPAELAKIPPMQMSDDGKYEFDRALGLMRKVAVTRRVTVANQRRVEAWAITMVAAPKR